ncbi:hypothetical protein C0Q70_14173 [Pomacea canaliculata]|uniref:Uncharacterized protein n=1 Tax=Pomacea canaliculata TaxID=400727 RepID=A0A2T7NZC8_POMCA|nr:uncharacterized protein LOC112570841 isoform X2 [Pomacea canaliculata]PVD26496.1 hypothetical protein C0Q70_14173 [Pomacea canaliculata]
MPPAAMVNLVTEKNARLTTALLAALLAAFGFFIVIPLSVTQAAVGGRCLLYADSVTFGPRSVCAYVVAVAAMFQLLYCICRAGLALLMTWGPAKTKLTILSPVKFLLPCAIADVLASVLTLVSAGVVSRGFSVMCSKIFYPKSDRCGTADIYSAVTDSYVTNYYVRLQVTEAGVWISLVLWLLLIVVDILSLSLSGLFSRLPFPLSRLDSLNRRLDVGTRHQDNKADNTNLPRPSPDFLTQMAARTPPPKRPVPPKPPCVAQPLMTSGGEPGPADEDSSFS